MQKSDNVQKITNPDNLKDIENNPNYKFVQGDITDLEKLNQVMKENKIDHVINFAT